MKKIKEGIYLANEYSKKYKTNMILVRFIMPFDVHAATANHLLSRMFEDGSLNIHSKSELEQKLANLYGADLSVSVKRSGNFLEFTLLTRLVRTSLLNENKEMMTDWFNLIKELLFNQKFDETNHLIVERFNHEKKLLEQALKRRFDNKNKLVIYKLYQTLYQEDDEKVIGGYGSLEVLKSLQLKDIQQAYNRIIDEAQVMVIGHGEFKGEMIESFVNEWPLKSRDVKYNFIHNQIKLEATSYPLQMEKMEAEQSKLAVAYKLPNISSQKERVTFMVANAVFGGMATSRLFMNIREKESLCYTIHSNLILQRQMLLVQAGIDPGQAEYVYKRIDEELIGIQEELENDDYFKEIKLSLKSNLVEAQDAQSNEIGLILSEFLRPDLDLSLDNYLRLIDETTTQDVQEAMKQCQRITGFYLEGGEANE